jgi:hypothetical protein
MVSLPRASATGRSWAARGTALGLALGAVVWANGCHDTMGPPPPPPPPARLIVSNAELPVTRVTLANALSIRGASATTPVAFVSLAPGTVPGGVLATITNLRTGDTLSVPVGAGGFDPVAVPAIGGDTLDIAVELSSGGSLRHLIQAVPLKHSPSVVRTYPSSGRRDVPLNTTIVVVFSEPIDSTTLTATTVQVRRGATPVAGTLGFVDAEHLKVLFAPAAPLAPATVYTLMVTQGIRDLEGDPLEASITAEFTTAATSSGYEEYFVDGYVPLSVRQVGDSVSVDHTVRVMDGTGTGIERALVRFRGSIGRVEPDTTRAGLDGLVRVHWTFPGIVGVLPPEASAELSACASNSTTRCDMYWPLLVVGFNPL